MALTPEETVEMNDLRYEVQRWKDIAGYLASCHAATFEGIPKSGPKSLRTRTKNICAKFVAFAEGKESPPRIGGSPGARLEWEIDRCRKVANTN